MALPFPLLSSVLFLMIVMGLNQAGSEPGMYWDEVLPDTPMPSAIKKLLPQVVAMKPIEFENVVDGTVDFERRGVGVNNNKPIVGMKSNGPAAFPAINFRYRKYSANEASDISNKPSTAIFLHRNDLRPGKQFTLQLAERDSRFATFIPYEEANAIPFSTSELPSILFRYSIPSGSNEATEMANTLQICEEPPEAGETKRCVTSLEAMVGFATMKFGTRDVIPVAMEGGGAHAAELWPYKVKAVRRVAVAGGKGAISCHPQPYAYAVFSCHSTADIEVYSVDLIAEDVSAAMTKVVAVCHLDTTIWDPKHIALRVLGVEPGKGAVCHFLPQGHIV